MHVRENVEYVKTCDHDVLIERLNILVVISKKSRTNSGDSLGGDILRPKYAIEPGCKFGMFLKSWHGHIGQP